MYETSHLITFSRACTEYVAPFNSEDCCTSITVGIFSVKYVTCLIDIFGTYLLFNLSSYLVYAGKLFG
jgi:hypothetical protein